MTGAVLVVAGSTFALPAPAEDATLPLDFAHDRDEIARSFPVATIEPATGGCLIVSPASFSAPVLAEDPRFGWRFSRATYVFAPRQIGAAKGWFRIVTLHHEPELRDQAQRTACLIGRLWGAYREHLGREVEFPLQSETADVYLASQTPPGEKGEGGETRNGKIYVFGAGVAARSPLEWVRTVAHEWGHLTLAAARGYHEPEPDAAGYLGERLFLKWLREDQPGRAAAAPDDGTTQADLDLYFHRQIAPLIDRYQKGGPAAATLDGADTASMDYYIGSVLATDDAFGSHVTGRALYTVLADRPRDFLIALRHEVSNTPMVTVHSPAWVPLRKGAYSLGSGPSTPSKSATRRLPVAQTSWHYFSDMGVLRLQRVEAAKP